MMEAFSALGVLLARNIAGWVLKSLEDGKIDKYEWQKLVATMFRTGMMTVALWAGVQFADVGIDVDVFSAAVAAALIDFVVKYYKKQ